MMEEDVSMETATETSFSCPETVMGKLAGMQSVPERIATLDEAFTLASSNVEHQSAFVQRLGFLPCLAAILTHAKTHEDKTTLKYLYRASMLLLWTLLRDNKDNVHALVQYPKLLEVTCRDVLAFSDEFAAALSAAVLTSVMTSPPEVIAWLQTAYVHWGALPALNKLCTSKHPLAVTRGSMLLAHLVYKRMDVVAAMLESGVYKTVADLILRTRTKGYVVPEMEQQDSGNALVYAIKCLGFACEAEAAAVGAAAAAVGAGGPAGMAPFRHALASLDGFVEALGRLASPTCANAQVQRNALRVLMKVAPDKVVHCLTFAAHVVLRNLAPADASAENKTMCCICYDEFTKEAPPVFAPCMHCYHGPCLEATLRHRDECPQCKHPVLSTIEALLQGKMGMYK